MCYKTSRPQMRRTLIAAIAPGVLEHTPERLLNAGANSREQPCRYFIPIPANAKGSGHHANLPLIVSTAEHKRSSAAGPPQTVFARVSQVRALQACIP